MQIKQGSRIGKLKIEGTDNNENCQTRSEADSWRALERKIVNSHVIGYQVIYNISCFSRSNRTEDCYCLASWSQYWTNWLKWLPVKCHSAESSGPDARNLRGTEELVVANQVTAYNRFYILSTTNSSVFRKCCAPGPCMIIFALDILWCFGYEPSLTSVIFGFNRY